MWSLCFCCCCVVVVCLLYDCVRFVRFLFRFGALSAFIVCMCLCVWLFWGALIWCMFVVGFFCVLG